MQRPSAVLDISAVDLQEIIEELSALPAEQQEVRLKKKAWFAEGKLSVLSL